MTDDRRLLTMKTPFPTRGARIALSGSVVRTKKDKGYLAEMAFVTKAMSLGFNVCKPMGETPGFDFVLESGRSVYKVQVKSGWVEWHGGYPVKISSAHRNYRAGAHGQLLSAHHQQSRTPGKIP